MTITTAESYLTQPDIDGGLVGGVSQDQASFRALINAVVTTYQHQDGIE